MKFIVEKNIPKEAYSTFGIGRYIPSENEGIHYIYWRFKCIAVWQRARHVLSVYYEINSTYTSRKTRKIVVIGIAVAVIMVLMSVIITISVSVMPRNEVEATSESNVIPQDLPKDPFLRAQKIQELFPLIDGHNDLPWRYR